MPALRAAGSRITAEAGTDRVKNGRGTRRGMPEATRMWRLSEGPLGRVSDFVTGGCYIPGNGKKPDTANLADR